MMKARGHSGWRLSPVQIGLTAAVVLLIVVVGILTVRTYLHISDTSSAFGESTYLTPNLSSVQREALRLHLETDKFLREPARDPERLLLLRAFLGAQIRVTAAATRNNPDVSQKIAEIQRMVEEYDSLLASVGENATLQQLAAASPRFDRTLTLLELRVKQLYDTEELRLLSNVNTSLDAQDTSQRLLIGMAATTVVLAILLAFSLRRSVTKEFRLAYRRLEYEVAERQRTEEALRDVEQQFRAVIDNFPVIIFALDRHGVFTLSEGRGLEALGRKPGQVVGQSIFDVYKDVTPITEGIRHTLNGKALGITVEMYGRSFDARYEPLVGPSGEVTGVVGVAHDVTERKREQEERERLLEEVSASQERLRVLSNELMRVQEAERRHIARELHDEIGQNLTGLRLTLEMSERLPADEAGEKLEEAKELVSSIIDSVRNITLDLRPPVLDDLGLVPGLLWYLDRYTSQTDVRVGFDHDGATGRFPADVETAAYRIVQEALTNVARHATVSEARVRLFLDAESLYVSVEDHGVGFDPGAPPGSGTSSGLNGMRERAELLGGTLTIESTRGEGTTLTARLPAPASLTGKDG